MMSNDGSKVGFVWAQKFYWQDMCFITKLSRSPLVLKLTEHVINVLANTANCNNILLWNHNPCLVLHIQIVASLLVSCHSPDSDQEKRNQESWNISNDLLRLRALRFQEFKQLPLVPTYFNQDKHMSGACMFIVSLHIDRVLLQLWCWWVTML